MLVMLTKVLRLLISIFWIFKYSMYVTLHTGRQSNNYIYETMLLQMNSDSLVIKHKQKQTNKYIWRLSFKTQVVRLSFLCHITDIKIASINPWSSLINQTNISMKPYSSYGNNLICEQNGCVMFIKFIKWASFYTEWKYFVFFYRKSNFRSVRSWKSVKEYKQI